MGGHSSREGLDDILLSCELDLLNSTISSTLMYYYRMVDDISTAVQGDFSLVRKLVSRFAHVFPDAMPLNIQISCGYSKFLDSHVFNVVQNKQSYGLSTSLAYKPLSRFNHVPFNSNISYQYKGDFKFFKTHFKYLYFRKHSPFISP